MRISRDTTPPSARPQKPELGALVSRSRASALVALLLSKLSLVRAATTTRRGKVITWSAVALLFVGGTWAALRALPDTTHLAHYELLALVVLVGVPANVVLNGARSMVAARLLGARPSIGACVRVSVLSAAANLLPIPGAFLVRVQWLKEIGAGYGAATLSSAMLAGAWIGVSATLAGAMQLGTGTIALGAVLLAAGVVTLTASWFVLRAQAPRRLATLTALKLLAIESLVAGIAAARIYIVVVAMGVGVTLAQALALTLGSVVASAAGVFPGGLGLREAVCAGLGPLVGLPASVSFLAAAIDRVLGMSAMLPISIYLAVRLRSSTS